MKKTILKLTFAIALFNSGCSTYSTPRQERAPAGTGDVGSVDEKGESLSPVRCNYRLVSKEESKWKALTTIGLFTLENLCGYRKWSDYTPWAFVRANRDCAEQLRSTVQVDDIKNIAESISENLAESDREFWAKDIQKLKSVKDMKEAFIDLLLSNRVIVMNKESKQSSVAGAGLEPEDRKAHFESIPRHFFLKPANSKEIQQKDSESLNKYYRPVVWNGVEYYETRMGNIAGDFDLGDISTLVAAADGQSFDDIYILNYANRSSNYHTLIQNDGNRILTFRILGVKKGTTVTPVLQTIESFVAKGTVLPKPIRSGETDNRVLKQRVIQQQILPVDGTSVRVDLTPEASFWSKFSYKTTSNDVFFDANCIK